MLGTIWTVLSNLGNYIVRQFLNLSAIKFIFFGGLYWLMSELLQLLSDLIGQVGIEGINSALNAIPVDVAYYLVVFRLDVGIPMILAAVGIRFLIRRLPVIG